MGLDRKAAAPDPAETASPDKFIQHLQTIDRIGARVFNATAMIVLSVGVIASLVFLIEDGAARLSSATAPFHRLQSFIPWDIDPNPSGMGPLIALIWNMWIGFPILALAACGFALCRKIASEFKR